MLQNTLPKTKTRIAVAMSGGVDSSVVACLLAQAGHDVVGFTAWTLNGPGKCCNDALVNAGRVCEQLGIGYDTVDLRAEFAHFVMKPYEQAYQAGLTPNPCVECNRHVKWELLVRYARETLNCDYVATGHYAQIDHQGPEPKVFRSVDTRKDQTYMMARVAQADFRHALFPLGAMTKPEVVAIAKELDLSMAHSKESQDVCFVLDGQANYLSQALGKRPGPIVDIETGQVLGEHEGTFYYTLGQRKGVKVSASRPIYVIKLDSATNTVYVGDAQHLESSRFKVLQPNWLDNAFVHTLEKTHKNHSAALVEVMVKIRYNSPPVAATITLDEYEPDCLQVTLKTPIQAVTPGQIAAFYDPGFTQLLGGGYIEQHLPHQPFNRETVEIPDLFACPV